MSIKELINELSKYPPEMSICLDDTMDNIKVEGTSYGVRIFEDLSDWYDEEDDEEDEEDENERG